MTNYINKVSDKFQKYEESDARLRKLTGFGIEQLIDMFAAGYTLKAPKHENLYSDNRLRDMIEKGETNI